MHLVIIVLTNGPIFLSSTALIKNEYHYAAAEWIIVYFYFCINQLLANHSKPCGYIAFLFMQVCTGGRQKQQFFCICVRHSQHNELGFFILTDERQSKLRTLYIHIRKYYLNSELITEGSHL